MGVEIAEGPIIDLEEYARIPIAFEVTRVFDVGIGDRPGQFVLTERSVDLPYLKDYDALESPGQWPKRFDVSNWRMFSARQEGHRIGGAVVAFKTAGLSMLEGRPDLAVLWDVRVSPEARRHGVGSSLFQAAAAWARSVGCRQVKVETQNINVPACRFYARMGCALVAFDRFAYPGLSDEIQLLWYKEL